ncbi:MAG: hypothetical protein AAGD35_15750 [Actinomycetota bacterium]
MSDMGGPEELYDAPDERTADFLAERTARLTPRQPPPPDDAVETAEDAAEADDDPGIDADTDADEEGEDDGSDDGGGGPAPGPSGPDRPPSSIGPDGGAPGPGADEQPGDDGGDDDSMARQRLEALRRSREQRLDELGGPSASLAIDGVGGPEAPPLDGANSWVPIGPAVLRQGQAETRPSTSGRVAGLVPVDAERTYVGAANGGVWRTDDAGRGWTSLMEAFDLNPTTTGADSLAVGALAVVPGASAADDRIYVGTGEGASGRYLGVGPVVSDDGGRNWRTESTAPTGPTLVGTAFYDLAVDPNDTDTVIAGTRRGLYRRQPGGPDGVQWERTLLAGSTNDWVTSVATADAGGGSTRFFATRWFGPVFTSTDGDNWSVLGSGFPTNRVGRVSIAVRPDDPSVVYALVALTGAGPAGAPVSGHLHGLYRLDTDDGVWRAVTGVPVTLFGPSPTGANARFGQGWYDMAVTVDPTDADRVYVGGSIVWTGSDWSGSVYRCDIDATGPNPVTAPVYLGRSVHGDIHRLAVAPGSGGNVLWLGCDGGAFRCDDPTADADEVVFDDCNTGLNTLTLNSFNQHPTEAAVMFSGSQDNGGIRYTGEEAWLYSSGGDGGAQVIDWNDPYRILSIFTSGQVRRSTDGGSRYGYTGTSVLTPPFDMANGETVLFYNPMVGTPYNPGAPAEASRVALGTNRVWLTDDFATSWRSIPLNTVADFLDGRIRSLLFTRFGRLFAGTVNGGVYRFNEVSPGSWAAPTRIDGVGAGPLELVGAPITDIAEDPTDPSGESIYVTLGGAGDYRHLWHFDGTSWEARSGPGPFDAASLLDVNHTAVIVDPDRSDDVYVGTDIGGWRSTDGGATWASHSPGLPDAGVIDLKIHPGERLLRASTHGRGMHEIELDRVTKPPVELYVRDTQLDQGRRFTVNWLPDPTARGEVVRHWDGPDIKVDTPDLNGDYQFAAGQDIDLLQFVDELQDDADRVASTPAADIVSRVYVQVHNRGRKAAKGVRVTLLVAEAAAGLPALPAGFDAEVRAGTPITSADWQTVGVDTIDDVRPDAPRIARFELPASMLAPPFGPPGAASSHYCLLALVHDDGDTFTGTALDADTLSRSDRKVAQKNLSVVRFFGTVPDDDPTPAALPIRVHGSLLDGGARPFDLIVRIGGYDGRVRLHLPAFDGDRPVTEGAVNLMPDDDLDPFRRWAGSQADAVARMEAAGQSFHSEMTARADGAVDAALSDGATAFEVQREEAMLQRLTLAPGSSRTMFLLFDRDEQMGVGESAPIDVLKLDSESGEILGGLTARIVVVPPAG